MTATPEPLFPDPNLEALHAEMQEVAEQTRELSMTLAATLTENMALKRILVELHQRACLEPHLEFVTTLEAALPELKMQRQKLTPRLKLGPLHESTDAAPADTDAPDSSTL